MKVNKIAIWIEIIQLPNIKKTLQVIDIKELLLILKCDAGNLAVLKASYLLDTHTAVFTDEMIHLRYAWE